MRLDEMQMSAPEAKQYYQSVVLAFAHSYEYSYSTIIVHIFVYSDRKRVLFVTVVSNGIREVAEGGGLGDAEAEAAGEPHLRVCVFCT